MSLIKREIYVNQVLDYLGKGLIVVLVGQRRVGKSCVLQCAIEEIKEQDPNANIIYINKEYTDFKGIINDADLDSYVASHLSTSAKNYLCVDEVQDIDHFENVLRSLQAKNLCDIIITGSNAKMMSSELSTYLSGRYIELHIHSLNYLEFIQFHALDNNNDSLLQYLTFGGLPQLAKIGLENKQMIQNYMSDIYNTIVLKDVVSRENIRNVRFLTDLNHFLSDNAGKNISANNISKFMKSQGQSISPAIVTNYIGYLCNAYIVDRTPRYDIHGRRLFETQEKYYFEDLGIRNFLSGGNILHDIEKIMENAVYLRLCQTGYHVTVGQLRKAEIDFVAEKNNERLYVQVTYLLSNEETRKREFGNLLAINDQHPKLVVCMDPLASVGQYEGVKCIHLKDFLSEK